MNMKGEITYIKKLVNDQEIILGYEVIIEFRCKPDLKLGECKIIQK